MLDLKPTSKILYETLKARLEAKKVTLMEVFFGDFDGVQFRLWTDVDKKEVLNVSLGVTKALESGQNDEYLKKIYGDWVVAPEKGYDFTLQMDTTQLDEAGKKKLLEDVPNLKNHYYASLFYQAMEKVKKKESFQPIRIPYRENESIFLTSEDNFTAIFSFVFNDEVDERFSGLFLQEMRDAKRVNRTLSSAPSVALSKGSVPESISKVDSPDVANPQKFYFLSLALYSSHVEKPFEAICNLLSLRSYLSYHLKCAKAYMHIRFRDQVEAYLKVLDEAKDRSGVEKIARAADGKYLTSYRRDKSKNM